MPAEPEARNAARLARSGIALPAKVVEDLRQAADRAGVALPPLAAAPLA